MCRGGDLAKGACVRRDPVNGADRRIGASSSNCCNLDDGLLLGADSMLKGTGDYSSRRGNRLAAAAKQAKSPATVCHGRSVGGADLVPAFGGGPVGRQSEARVAGVAGG